MLNLARLPRSKLPPRPIQKPLLKIIGNLSTPQPRIRIINRPHHPHPSIGTRINRIPRRRHIRSPINHHRQHPRPRPLDQHPNPRSERQQLPIWPFDMTFRKDPNHPTILQMRPRPPNPRLPMSIPGDKNNPRPVPKPHQPPHPHVLSHQPTHPPRHHRRNQKRINPTSMITHHDHRPIKILKNPLLNHKISTMDNP